MFWIELEDGTIVDLSKSQFNNEEGIRDYKPKDGNTEIITKQQFESSFLSNIEKQTETPTTEVTEGVEVTPEVLSEGNQEVTDVTEGIITTSKPVKIFKGIGGKKDLQGFRINAHEGAEGVFSSVDESFS